MQAFMWIQHHPKATSKSRLEMLNSQCNANERQYPNGAQEARGNRSKQKCRKEKCRPTQINRALITVVSWYEGQFV
jgi:hypothetical protein